MFLPGAALLGMAGCSVAPKPGVADVPPLPRFEYGVYTDVNPRWSHDGTRIAFLRSTPDRRLQLFVTDPDMERATALLEAEIVRPDRPYDPQSRRYSSPDTLAWSPDDRKIAFERAEWFQFDDGQRLPGTGIWAFELLSGRVAPLALHPKRYTDLYYYYHTPAWSPDGSYVAFAAEGINGQHLIGLRCVAIEKPKEVALRFDNYASSDWPVWRGRSAAVPSGIPYARERPVLAYCQSIFRTAAIPATATLRCIQPGSSDSEYCREIWRMNPARCRALSTIRRRSDPRDVIEPRVGHPVWSPDGRQLAFTLTPNANDYSRYELWVLDVEDGISRRVSPDDGRGYVAPVWIDGLRLGALSPNKTRFDVVSISIRRHTRRLIGTIATADCDWSPDRKKIVYAEPRSSTPNSPDEPTTLRVLETNLKIRGPWRPEVLEE